VTVFVGIVLSLASVAFQRDTQKLVIRPIMKMVSIIQNLAASPLGKDPSEFEEIEVKKKSDGQTMLEETIDKVGSLLQIAFGEDGSNIIRKCTSENGDIELSHLGKKQNIIIGYARIAKFDIITDCLEKEVMVFLNKICKIVHECCVQWYGSPSKNEMGAMLMIWPIEPENETDQAANSLLSFVKIIAEIRRANDIQTYKNNPKI
jgi:hypothetical protein